MPLQGSAQSDQSPLGDFYVPLHDLQAKLELLNDALIAGQLTKDEQELIRSLSRASNSTLCSLLQLADFTLLSIQNTSK